MKNCCFQSAAVLALTTALTLCTAVVTAQTVGDGAANDAGSDAAGRDPAPGGGPNNALEQVFTWVPGLPSLPARVTKRVEVPPAYILSTNQDGSVSLVTNLAGLRLARLPARPTPRIRVGQDGAESSGSHFSVTFDGNLNSSNAIVMKSEAGQELNGHVAGLAASDSSGQRVWLAALQDSQGYVVPTVPGKAARVIYTNAMKGVQCDIVYDININSVVQDVFVREPVVLPKELDPATARLEVISVFTGPPAPRKTPRTLSLVDETKGPARPEKRAVTEDLDWGSAAFIDGRAFRWQSGNSAGGRQRWPVAKRWIEAEDGASAYLVESVDFESIAPALEGLRTASHADGERRATGYARTAFGVPSRSQRDGLGGAFDPPVPSDRLGRLAKFARSGVSKAGPGRPAPSGTELQTGTAHPGVGQFGVPPLGGPASESEHSVPANRPARSAYASG